MVPVEKSVDAVINVYGKPYQTAVTLFSLLRHSGQWIDKIYFIEERKQPQESDFQFIRDALGERLIHYKPRIRLPLSDPIPAPWLLLKFPVIRHAIRYQYGWEKTDKKFLLVLHNDVLFKDDLVGQYLKNIENHTGIGRIGQCWNCPAYHGNLCLPEKYTEYRPTAEEVLDISKRYHAVRAPKYKAVMAKMGSWPLPECRLNEYVAMINLEKAKPSTIPFGSAPPFGSYNIVDLGIEWFYKLNNAGHTFAHFDYDPYATHSWVSLRNAGHDALFNKDLYQYEEQVAKDLLEREYGLA